MQFRLSSTSDMPLGIELHEKTAQHLRYVGLEVIVQWICEIIYLYLRDIYGGIGLRSSVAEQ